MLLQVAGAPVTLEPTSITQPKIEETIARGVRRPAGYTSKPADTKKTERYTHLTKNTNAPLARSARSARAVAKQSPSFNHPRRSQINHGAQDKQQTEEREAEGTTPISRFLFPHGTPRPTVSTHTQPFSDILASKILSCTARACTCIAAEKKWGVCWPSFGWREPINPSLQKRGQTERPRAKRA